MGSELVVRRQILICLTFLLEGLNDAPFLQTFSCQSKWSAQPLRFCDGFEKRKGNFPPVEGFCSVVRDSPYRPEPMSLPRRSEHASPAGPN